MGVKSFLGSRVGFWVLILIGIATVTLGFFYLGPLLAIVIILLFGLLLPILVGVKRPLLLAVIGIVIILVSAPLVTALETQLIFTPSPVACSGDTCTGSLLQNATENPYSTSSNSATFFWNVTLFPSTLAPGSGNVTQLMLFIANGCPGATGNSSPNCAAGYPYYQIDDIHLPAHMLGPENATPWTITFIDDQTAFPGHACGYNVTTVSKATSTSVVEFDCSITGPALWSWQMAAAYNNSGGNFTWSFLVGDPTYNSIQGPIVGTFGSIYVLVLGTTFEYVGFYLGLPFFIILLVYLALRGRRQRMQARNWQPPPSSDATPAAAVPSSTAPGAAPSPAPTPIPESACPNCAAVVYPGEKVCWKCGTPIAPAAGSAALPSQPRG